MSRAARAALLALFPRLALRFLRPTTAELGRLGEALAARHLARHGLAVVARRLRTAAAELDLVVRDGDALACVEVKTGRRGPRFTPGDRVDRRRLERLHRAARILAVRSGRPVRVDLVEVQLTDGSRRPTIVHHRDLCAPLTRPRGPDPGRPDQASHRGRPATG